MQVCVSEQVLTITYCTAQWRRSFPVYLYLGVSSARTARTQRGTGQNRGEVYKGKWRMGATQRSTPPPVLMEICQDPITVLSTAHNVWKATMRLDSIDVWKWKQCSVESHKDIFLHRSLLSNLCMQWQEEVAFWKHAFPPKVNKSHINNVLIWFLHSTSPIIKYICIQYISSMLVALVI